MFPICCLGFDNINNNSIFKCYHSMPEFARKTHTGACLFRNPVPT